MNRREFMGRSAGGAVALTMAGPAVLSPQAEVLVLATDWGFEGDIYALCKKVRQAGYDGIEVWWSSDPVRKQQLREALKEYNLRVGFLCGGNGADFKAHLEQYKGAVEQALEWEPLYINSHSGKDFFTFEQNSRFIEFSLEKKGATEILHETHRGRMCYSVPVTTAFLARYPEMKLTLDISHWTNVHESLLDDQAEAVNEALRHTRHIHARVGHQQGPQVNDPRAPEWENAMKRHLEWWDSAVKYQSESGKKQITFLTEFGPPTYLPTLPYTRQPLVNQWEVNVYMLNLLKARYRK